jgi:hypothetical protein
MKRHTCKVAVFTASLLVVVNQSNADEAATRMFMDVHQLDSVTAADVADAHLKDLAVQDKYGVNFIRYWVDEENAKVYCLSEAHDAKSVTAAHTEAHGLVPQSVHEVTAGEEAVARGESNLFFDVHKVGAGKVTSDDVAAAHEKDLVTQELHGVNFINYWVDPRSGDIFCLSEAESAEAVLTTHREAHGLVSDEIALVAQGE